MPPQTRLEPSVTIQPAPGTTPSDVQAEISLANQQARGAAATQEVAGQVQQVASQVMRDETLKQAQEDAAQVLTPDDIEGKRGWGGLVYNQAYRQAAIAQYQGIAISEAQNKGQELTIQYPTNPEMVGTKLTEYLDAKKKAMPEHMANVLTPHFDAVLRGSVASSSAGKIRQEVAVLDQQVKQQLTGYIMGVSTAVTAMRNATPDEIARTQELWNSKWKILEDQMRGANYTDAQINQIKGESWAQANAHAKGREMQQQAAAAVNDPVTIAQLSEEAILFAQDPARSQYYAPIVSILQGYIERGARMAGAVQQAIAIDQTFAVGGIADRWARLNAVKDQISKEDYDRQAEQIKTDALVKGVGRLPGQQAQLIAAAGDKSAVLQQMYGSAMLQASGRALYGDTPAARTQGYEEVRQITTDPHVISMAGNSQVMAGLIQQGQKILADRQATATLPDQIALAAQLESKDLTAKDLPAIIKGHSDSGLIGPSGMSPAQAAAHARIGLAKNKEFQDQVALTQNADRRWNVTPGSLSSPEPARPEESAAFEKTHPVKFFKPDAAGKPTETPFDHTSQAHLDIALGTVARRGYLPDPVKNWIGGLSSTSSPEDQQRAVGIASSVEQIVGQKYASQPEGIRGKKIFEATKEIMGDDAAKRVWAFKQAPGDPAKIEKLLAVDPSGRQASKDDKDGFVEALTKSTRDGLSQGYLGGKPGLGTQAAMWGAQFLAGFSTSEAAGQGWLREMTMFDKASIAAAVSGLPSFGTETMRDASVEGTPQIWSEQDGVMIEPNAIAALKVMIAGDNGLLELDGGANRQQGYNPQEQAFIKAMQKNPDKFSVIYTTDATGKPQAVLTYRDYRAEFNARWKPTGGQFTDNQIKNFAMIAMRASSPYFANQMDPNTIDFMTRVMPDNSVEWYMTARHKDPSQPGFKLQVRPDDPIHDTTQKQLSQNIAAEIKASTLNNFISTTWGLDLMRHMIKENKQETMLNAASGRNGPGASWAALITNMQDGVESYVAEQVKMGNTNVQNISKADWERLKTDEAQRSINRYGSLYTLFFGTQSMAPLLGQAGSLDRPSTTEVDVPAPIMTPGIQGGAAERSREEADPKVRELVEKLQGVRAAPPPGTPPKPTSLKVPPKPTTLKLPPRE